MTVDTRQTFHIAVVMACIFLAAVARAQVAVDVVKPVRQLMPEEIVVTGTLIANEWVRVAPEIAGVVKSLPFSEGGEVRQGDLLLELDDALHAAEYRQAKASYELAEHRFERNQRLYKSHSVSQAVYEEALAELSERKAALEVADVRLSKTRILSPFDGHISLRDTSIGAYVMPGQELFVVVDDQPLRLNFRVPERLADIVRPGTSVEFELPGRDRQLAQRFEASIVAVQPAITPASRTLRAEAEYPNHNREMLAGSFARVVITVGKNDEVLVIPEQALIGAATGYHVFVVEGDRAKRRDVKIGVRRSSMVSVVSGLQDEDVVVVAGHQYLRDGSSVKIRNGN